MSTAEKRVLGKWDLQYLGSFRCAYAERRMKFSCVAPNLVVEARPYVFALPSLLEAVKATEVVAENRHFGRRRVSHS